MCTAASLAGSAGDPCVGGSRVDEHAESLILAADLDVSDIADVVGFDVKTSALDSGRGGGEGEIVGARGDEVDLGVAFVSYLLDGGLGFGTSFKTRAAKEVVHDAGEESTLHVTTGLGMAGVALTRLGVSSTFASRECRVFGEKSTTLEDADFAPF